MEKINHLIEQEELKFEEASSPKIKSEILYNLIFIKNKNESYNNQYKDIKLFFNLYIEAKKEANFGYDNFNYTKINNLIDILTPVEKPAIAEYFISKLSKELPESNREWFVKRKHDFEVSLIFHKKNI